MATFEYTALRGSGERYKGTLEAENKFVLYEQVRKEGGVIVSVKEKSNTAGWWAKLNDLFSTVPMREQIGFARNLAAMVQAGLGLARALGVLERQTSNPKLKNIIQAIGVQIGAGTPLNVALSKFPRVFSPLFVSMVRAGEESGGLPKALRVIAEQMERSYALRKKIIGALIYPAIVIVAMIGIAVLMLVYIVPTLEQTFAELGADLPASTRSIIAASNFLLEHQLLALLFAVVLFLSIFFGLRTSSGKKFMDFTILHLPLISGIAKEANTARTARSLSSLLAAGVEVLTALRITSDILQNAYYKDVLARAGKEVEKGQSLSGAFVTASKLYPPLMGEMVMVGEETGDVGGMLAEIASFYEEEVERQTKDISTIVEPFLMILVGAGVGFFAISMITPIYSLSTNI